MITRISKDCYNTLLNLIKINYIKKKYFFQIYYVKRLVLVLDLLCNLKYIRKYEIHNKYIIDIYLYNDWDSTNMSVKLKICYKPSNPVRIKINRLKRFYSDNLNQKVVLLTSKVLLTHTDAIKQNQGGKLFFILY